MIYRFQNILMSTYVCTHGVIQTHIHICMQICHIPKTCHEFRIRTTTDVTNQYEVYRARICRPMEVTNIK